MFLVNSRYPHFTATHRGYGREVLDPGGRTFSRSYGTILPSSLKRLLSNALEYSSRPPESVYGTDTKVVNSAGAFLGSVGLLSSRTLSVLLITSRAWCSKHRPSVCPIKGPRRSPYGLKPGNPRAGSATLLRPSCGTILGGTGLLTCFPSPTLFSLGLGPD